MNLYFSSRRRHTRWPRDWSSDVCSSDLGVLTTIDPEVENQRAAREAFAEAKIRTPRVRTIAGQPREVVRRLTDHAYDLVSFPAHDPHALDLLGHARRQIGRASCRERGEVSGASG